MIYTHIKSGNNYPPAVLASVSPPSSITITWGCLLASQGHADPKTRTFWKRNPGIEFYHTLGGHSDRHQYGIAHHRFRSLGGTQIVFYVNANSSFQLLLTNQTHETFAKHGNFWPNLLTKAFLQLHHHFLRLQELDFTFRVGSTSPSQHRAAHYCGACQGRGLGASADASTLTKLKCPLPPRCPWASPAAPGIWGPRGNSATSGWNRQWTPNPELPDHNLDIPCSHTWNCSPGHTRSLY